MGSSEVFNSNKTLQVSPAPTRTTDAAKLRCSLNMVLFSALWSVLEQISGACPRACVVVPGEVGLLWSFELALVLEIQPLGF